MGHPDIVQSPSPDIETFMRLFTASARAAAQVAEVGDELFTIEEVHRGDTHAHRYEVAPLAGQVALWTEDGSQKITPEQPFVATHRWAQDAVWLVFGRRGTDTEREQFLQLSPDQLDHDVPGKGSKVTIKEYLGDVLKSQWPPAPSPEAADDFSGAMSRIVAAVDEAHAAERQVGAARNGIEAALDNLSRHQAAAQRAGLVLTYEVSPAPGTTLFATNRHTGFPVRPDRHEPIVAKKGESFQAIKVVRGRSNNSRNEFESTVDFVGPEVPFDAGDARLDEPGSATPGHTVSRVQIPLKNLQETIRVRVRSGDDIVCEWPPAQDTAQA